MKKVYPILVAVAILVAGYFMLRHAVSGGSVVVPMPYIVEKIDTVEISSPVYLPVPSGTDTVRETTYINRGVAITRVDTVRDTVYAQCDTAMRYVSEYKDSLVSITVSSDVCGALLSSNIRYSVYRKTIIESHLVGKNRLYAVAGSSPSAGVSFATPRFIFGYTYSLNQNIQGIPRHGFSVGINLFGKKWQRR